MNCVRCNAAPAVLRMVQRVRYELLQPTIVFAGKTVTQKDIDGAFPQDITLYFCSPCFLHVGVTGQGMEQRMGLDWRDHSN